MNAGSLTKVARRVLDDEILVGGIERESDDRYSWEARQVRYNGRAGRLSSHKGNAVLTYDKIVEGESAQLLLVGAEDFFKRFEIVDGELKRKNSTRMILQ